MQIQACMADMMGVESIRNVLECKPYKLILFKEGCFSKLSFDNVMEEGHIATFALELPSEYEGGDVTYEYKDVKETVKSSGNYKTYHYQCFFTRKVQRDISTVTKGNRLVLMFSVVKKESDNLIAKDFVKAKNKLTEALVSMYSFTINCRRMICCLEYLNFLP